MGGFWVPSGLQDSDASGLDLIHYVQSLWLGVPAPAGNAGQLALADWIVAHPQEANRMRVSSSVVERLLTGELVPGDATRADVGRATDGAVSHELWDQPASAAKKRLTQAARADGDGTTAPPPAAVPSPVPSPNCHGRLGERASGKAFTAVRGPGGTIILTSCYGLTMAMDDWAATAAHRELGIALGLAGAGAQ